MKTTDIGIRVVIEKNHVPCHEFLKLPDLALEPLHQDIAIARNIDQFARLRVIQQFSASQTFSMPKDFSSFCIRGALEVFHGADLEFCWINIFVFEHFQALPDSFHGKRKLRA